MTQQPPTIQELAKRALRAMEEAARLRQERRSMVEEAKAVLGQIKRKKP